MRYQVVARSPGNLTALHKHINPLKAEKREKGAANFNTVYNHIRDFVGHKKALPIELITIDFLKRFELFLRSERIMYRTDRLGKEYRLKGKPLGDASVHVYLRDFSGLFSAATEFYNKPSIGVLPIKFNPFNEFSIVDAPETKRGILKPLKLKPFKVHRLGRVPGAKWHKNFLCYHFIYAGLTP